MTSRRIIYGLRDPRTAEIRYVGKSARGLVRIKEHYKASGLCDGTHRSNWIGELLRLGLSFEAVVLEHISATQDIDEAECWWIAIGRQALGDRLTNATTGGEGVVGCKRSAETCRKMAAAWTPERRARQAAACRERLVAKQIGRPLSAEHRKKLSQTAKQRAPELAAHFAAINRGRVFSPEHRARLSSAQRARYARSHVAGPPQQS